MRFVPDVCSRNRLNVRHLCANVLLPRIQTANVTTTIGLLRTFVFHYKSGSRNDNDETNPAAHTNPNLRGIVQSGAIMSTRKVVGLISCRRGAVGRRRGWAYLGRRSCRCGTSGPGPSTDPSRGCQRSIGYHRDDNPCPVAAKGNRSIVNPAICLAERRSTVGTVVQQL